MKWLRWLFSSTCNHECSCRYVEIYHEHRDDNLTPVKMRCERCGLVFMSNHHLPRDFKITWQ